MDTMRIIKVILVLYCGFIGIMENKMATTVQGLGLQVGPCIRKPRHPYSWTDATVSTMITLMTNSTIFTIITMPISITMITILP